MLFKGSELSYLVEKKKISEVAKVIQEILISQGFSAFIKENKIEFLKTKGFSSTKGMVHLEETKKGTMVKVVFRGHLSYIAGFVIFILFVLLISIGLAIVLLIVIEYLANERAKTEMSQFQQALIHTLN